MSNMIEIKEFYTPKPTENVPDNKELYEMIKELQSRVQQLENSKQQELIK